MSSTDIQQVCLNGHQITDGINMNPELTRKFCPKCGVETITACSQCKAPIPGYTSYENYVSFSREPVPSNCHNCGEPYPWTAKGQVASANAKHCNPDDPFVLVEKMCHASTS